MSDTTRQNDYVINDAYGALDSVEIKIPDGYKPESIPKNISLDTKFGKYNSSVKVLDNSIIYYRFMEQYNGRFSPNEFNELVKFYEQVYKSDRGKVVLVKSE